MPPDLFGICVVATHGAVFSVGDAEVEFAIMSVAKPFVFALVCQSLGPEEARRLLGVNSTGLRSTRWRRSSGAPTGGRTRW